MSWTKVFDIWISKYWDVDPVRWSLHSRCIYRDRGWDDSTAVCRTLLVPLLSVTVTHDKVLQWKHYEHWYTQYSEEAPTNAFSLVRYYYKEAFKHLNIMSPPLKGALVYRNLHWQQDWQQFKVNIRLVSKLFADQQPNFRWKYHFNVYIDAHLCQNWITLPSSPARSCEWCH